MRPLISVIVPAYNREKTIAAALSSVIAQDYDNLEIIVDDDGSSDGTANTARGVLENSSRRWRVLHHERNRGVSAARNTGLDAASGEYVNFMDSDDLVDEPFISTLYGLASENGCDVVFCGYRKRYETGAEREVVTLPRSLKSGRIYSGEELALKQMMASCWGGVWTILFRKDFLLSKGLRFDEGLSYGEDENFSVKAMTRSGKVVFSQRHLYVYVRHDSMSWRAAIATKEKHFASYMDCISANLNAVRYMAEHVGSPEILKTVRHLLLPKYQLKKLKIYAWLGDYETFRKELALPGTRGMLLSSWKTFFKDPRIFLKALLLMAFPKLVFEIRRRTS
ncbi:MAG: glycosyltransferase family 2 protein, partial [Synergistaceae bacterium]|nr:glycosyltransferase family 2 protein [Synergistaceae bacterium]